MISKIRAIFKSKEDGQLYICRQLSDDRTTYKTIESYRISNDIDKLIKKKLVVSFIMVSLSYNVVKQLDIDVSDVVLDLSDVVNINKTPFEIKQDMEKLIMDTILEEYEIFKCPKINKNDLYCKWFIMDVNGSNGNPLFLANDEAKVSWTYNINKSKTFLTKTEAESYIAENPIEFLCPSVLDFRLAEGIAGMMSHYLIYKEGSHVGEYYF